MGSGFFPLCTYYLSIRIHSYLVRHTWVATPSGSITRKHGKLLCTLVDEITQTEYLYFKNTSGFPVFYEHKCMHNPQTLSILYTYIIINPYQKYLPTALCSIVPPCSYIFIYYVLCRHVTIATNVIYVPIVYTAQNIVCFGYNFEVSVSKTYN